MSDIGEQRPGDRWWDTDELDTFDSTLANLAEIVFGCLDAAGARSVVEIGAEYGLFTEELLAWAGRAGADRVIAVDPVPDRRLTALADANGELDLVVATSHDALAELEPTDAVIIDGDHNYYTVREELRLIAERAGTDRLPLILLHDIGWPLGRRDSYYAPDRIPHEHRQPIYEGAFLVPDEPGVAAHGLFFEQVAQREGGAANGVLTAVEDFVASDEKLDLAIVAPFFGLGVVWHRGAPWAQAVGDLLAPWDRNPLVERLERKRIDHLVAQYVTLQHLDSLRRADYARRHEALSKLVPMHDSFALTVGERVSRLRGGRERPSLSREALSSVIAVMTDDDLPVERFRGQR